MPIQHISFNIRLYTAEPLDDGKCPIVLQVSWRDDKANVRRKRLGISCLPSEFDQDQDCIIGSAWSSTKLNGQLKTALSRAKEIYRDNFSNKDWDYKRWAELYDEKEAPNTFDTFAEGVISKLYAMGKAGTAVYYRDTLRALQKYLGKTQIHFEEVTKSVLKDFEADIISRGHKGERTMRGLKGLFSKAIEDEVIDMKLMPFKTGYNPIGYKFGHLKKIKKPSSLIKRLSKDQVRTLLEYKPKNEGEERAMDLWKFSYFTMGTNLKDIAMMKLSDVRDGLWFFERAKTNNSSLGKPLLPECLEIVQKYSNPKNKYVFDFILQDRYDKSDKAINERKRDVTSNLRDWYVKISSDLGFNGHFSFYSARYTSATISANKGADMRAVQANLSHSSLTTTEIYSQFRNEEAMRESLELLRV
ncbi:MAG: site-specific integrase [Saprospiraceae bacterium]|nr:site-specific integrase [Candidatus Opimibacter skivensis]